jgi:2-polyprenyl-3-methyl-5-hydroxy-6-metoxy-1,4-benzoquinol methylase
MNLYDSLANYYNDIFPLDNKRVEFIRSSLEKNKGKILDLGCATGELACALAQAGYLVTGLDLNARMISLAQQQSQTQGLSIDWYVADMLQFMEKAQDQYEAILCFGNTLPHLASLTDVQNFFNLSYQRLSADGILLIQILNYDKILNEQKAPFPVIETANVVFEREYHFAEHITFNISLQDKTSGKIYKDTTTLLPILKKQMAESAAQAGFRTLNAYADYQFKYSDLSEWSTLYELRK